LGQWIATNIVISLIISGFNTVDYLLKNWKRTAVEAAQHKMRASKHKQAAMAAELQALKLQIDPHFIFNNLSVFLSLFSKISSWDMNIQKNLHGYTDICLLIPRKILLL
jgi:LytS/YehU family sensor histidine kinase